MAKPVYIICSESGSEDKTTGLISHFKVFEKVEIRELEERREGEVAVVVALPMQVVAVWARSESDDHGDEFEHRFLFFVPPECEEKEVAAGMFFFEKDRFRFTVNIQGQLFRGPGIFRAESRIRKKGDEDWLIQSYELLVSKVESRPEQT